jgi:tetratricopeptide (TPR) repeat protein
MRPPDKIPKPTPEAAAYSLFEAGRFAEAASAWSAIVERSPSDPEALHMLGYVLAESGRPAEGIAYLDRSIDLLPRNAAMRSNRALVLRSLGRDEEALRDLRRALQIEPKLPAALDMMGSIHFAAGRFDESLAAYRRALAADPRFTESLVGVGVVQAHRGELDAAEASYRAALAIDARNANAQLNLGVLKLRRQDFATGWDLYEARLRTRRFASSPKTNLPELTLENLGRARCVALWSEQGLGDQVLYSTLLVELERRSISAVVEIDARLHPAYRRRFPAMRFVTGAESVEAFRDCDFKSPMVSLARLFRRDRESFAAQPAALLAADPARVHEMRDALGPGRWVAISWASLQAGDREALGRRKTVPLACFAKIAGEGSRLLDLQYGELPEERERFNARHPGTLTRLEGLDAFNDIEGVLAAIEACELVITASNVLAHLAGAIGKPTWLAYLPGREPFHYWVPGDDRRSLWYPSVEVAMDETRKSWEEVFDAFAARLRAA